MRYRFSLQQRQGAWVYVLNFGKETPTDVGEILAYCDDNVSGEDPCGVRHFVYFKDGKLVSIQLHDALRLVPYVDPARPDTLRMPGLHPLMLGNPQKPSLLIQFRDEPPDNRTAYAISPNVYLVFHGTELAQLYIFDVHAVIADVG
jgi:hypothetical protein